MGAGTGGGAGDGSHVSRLSVAARRGRQTAVARCRRIGGNTVVRGRDGGVSGCVRAPRGGIPTPRGGVRVRREPARRATRVRRAAAGAG